MLIVRILWYSYGWAWQHRVPAPASSRQMIVSCGTLDFELLLIIWKCKSSKQLGLLRLGVSLGIYLNPESYDAAHFDVFEVLALHSEGRDEVLPGSSN